MQESEDYADEQELYAAKLAEIRRIMAQGENHG